MDLTGIPAIDTHAHPFPREAERITDQWLRDALSVSLRGHTSPLNASMLLCRVTIKELARLLDCAPTWSAVIDARNQAAEHNLGGYTDRLFTDAGLAALLVDHGFPAAPAIAFNDFVEYSSRPTFQGYRIERLFPGPGAGSMHGPAFPTVRRSFADLLETFEARLDAAIIDEQCKFFKTIIAYRTGLAIKPTSRGEAAAAWQAHQQTGDPYEKIVRDYLFVVAAAKARQHGVPFQVHTGHTSHANVWPNVNPILLTPILNSGLLDDVTLVLVHGGYPYCTEGGYLTSVFSNLYLDLSLMIPWASIGIKSRILQTLESAPTAKIMYGSDGIMTPELHWISAILTRRALGAALDELMATQFINVSEADEIAEAILHQTARRVYNLPAS